MGMILRLLLFAAMPFLGLAADPQGKPTPTPTPPAANVAASKPKPAAVTVLPKVSLNVPAPKDCVVEGVASDTSHVIRVSIFHGGSTVETREVRTDAAKTFVAGFHNCLVPGDVVEGFVLQGTTEIARSIPIAVIAGSAPVVKPAAAPVRAPTVTSVKPAPTTATDPASAADPPGDPCADGNPDAFAAPSLSDGDTEIKGNTSIDNGNVSVCVNGFPRPLGGGQKYIRAAGFTYDVMVSAPALAGSDRVRIIVEGADGSRVITTATVSASKKVTAKPCDAAVPPATPDTSIGALQIQPNLRAGDTEIKAVLPGPGGTVNVCVNGVSKNITDATSAGAAAATDTVAGSTLDVKLATADKLLLNQDVVIAWTSKDQTKRVTLSTVVLAPKFGTVRLTGSPREGQDTLYVNTLVPVAAPASGTAAGSGAPSAPASTGLSVSVYVNGDQVTLIDSGNNGADALSIATNPTGSTAIKLKTPLDGGDCVAVVEFTTGQPPLNFDKDLDRKDFECTVTQGIKKGKRRAGDPTPAVEKGIPAAVHEDFSVSKPQLASSVFDFGRVRGYMAAGSLFSFDGNNFSQPNIFLSFNVTRNWLWGGPYRKTVPGKNKDIPDVEESYKRLMFETFFESRLTALPVATCATSTTTTATSSTPTATATTPSAAATTSTQGGASPACTSDQLGSFISSQKAATLTGGAWAPIIVDTWNYLHQPYALSIGPLAKVGFDTPAGAITQSGSTAVAAATNQAFYTNFGFGVRLGLHKMSYSTDVAPKLESYIDVTTGRFSNFDAVEADGSTHRPWRIAVEGLLQVPATPFFMGFSANVHQNFGLGSANPIDNARDDLRILFGAKFDAGKLFDKVISFK